MIFFLLQFRFRLLLWKSFESGSGPGSGSSSGARLKLDSFSTTKYLTKILPFSARSSIVSQKVGLYFLFLIFVLHFMFDPSPNPVPEPERITVLVPLRPKFTVPAVPALVPQHCTYMLTYGINLVV
jgi:hypothetical protein